VPQHKRVQRFVGYSICITRRFGLNLKSLIAPGIKAVKDNWRPIVLIQVCFLIFVILYYTVPSIQGLPDKIDGFKRSVGAIPFVLGVIWFVSIVVPEIAKRITGQKVEPIGWKDLVLRMVYFASIGISINWLYDWMNVFIGSDVKIGTVMKKILVDQLIYSPLISMPLATLTFLYRDTKFSTAKSTEKLKQGEFPKRYFPLLMTCFMYFGPVTIAMYSLPLGLTFPVAMTAQAAWGIIVVAVGSHKEPEAAL
jgi:hypothetical protein